MVLTKEKEGIIYGALSYMFWGLIPVYWKLLEHINALEILANRVLWSFMFMILLLIVTKKVPALFSYIKEIIVNRRKVLALLAAAFLVSINWGTFIWAVNNGRILETSLGYYINPLISVLLAVTVLKEKLSKVQVGSVCLAAIGVIILTVYSGQFPWISFTLAISFAFYGLVKVLIGADAAIGLTLETLMMVPIAAIYCFFLILQGNSMFFPISNSLLLMGGGVATAVPLLLFALGANSIPLSMLGFLQYISPTLSLLVGVFLYHEAFTKVHGVAFLFIWSALVLFSLSQMKMRSRIEKQVGEKVEV